MEKEMKEMKKKAVLLAMAGLLLMGCGQKVVTVADIQNEDGPDTGYIQMQEFELKEKETDSGREEVRLCTVLIPAGYQRSEEIEGMYVHERSPLDSSNIYYSVSEGEGDGKVSERLTEKSYEELVEATYRQEGMDVDLEVEDFEEIDMEGVPGYKIKSSYELEDNRVEQLTYLIIAEDTYTITYSQLSDDELMVDFEVTDGQIRLVRDGEVDLAVANGED